MPLDERLLAQNDPNIDTIADLQRSITATLAYIMGRASVADLFRLHAYLSARAAEVVQGEGSPALDELDDSWAQELERRRQQGIYEKALAHHIAQYRQKG